jgi:predicted PhzF superfamily epimerase YddE/YHI9
VRRSDADGPEVVNELHVLRVFVGPDGRGGNPLAVFLDAASIPTHARLAIAADLGFSETVFVDDAVEGTIRIFTPTAELSFAGHPTVGTSWLLQETGAPTTVLRPPAGEVSFHRDQQLAWIRADGTWVGDFRREQLASTAAVDEFAGPTVGQPGVYVWAWADETVGEIRARCFPTDYGIAEDEATGAAAVAMGRDLRRNLTIRQGVGSEILVRPLPDGMIEIGGRVELVERRRYRLAPR